MHDVLHYKSVYYETNLWRAPFRNSLSTFVEPSGCHAERSEESACGRMRILRCAQHDRQDGFVKLHRLLQSGYGEVFSGENSFGLRSLARETSTTPVKMTTMPATPDEVMRSPANMTPRHRATRGLM